MIQTLKELRIVITRAERWERTLRAQNKRELSATERADLAHVLEELAGFCALNARGGDLAA